MRYDSRLFRLLVAVAAAGLALSLRVAAGIAFEPFAPPQTSWLCFLPGVVFSAWYGGLKPGMVTSGLLLIAGFSLEASRLPLLPGTGLASPEAPFFGAALFVFASLAVCAAMQRLRTEHFRAQRSSARLHEVLESTPDAVLSLDPEFRCLYANARAGLIARKQPALLYGKSLRTVFPESPGVVIYKELHRAMREGAPVHFEDRGPAAGWYAFYACPATSGMNLFVRDITSRKVGEAQREAAARALALEHDRLETVLREMPVGVIITSPDRRIELVNNAAAWLLGVPVKPGDHWPGIPGAAFSSLDGVALPPENGPVSRTLRTGQRIEHQEVLYTRTDGSVATLIVNALPLHAPDGTITGALSSYLDVTALRDTQKALLASESRLQRLFNSPAIGFVSGNEHEILEANDAWLSMLGYTREDLRSGHLRWPEMMLPENGEADSRTRRQLAEKGFCDPVETELKTKNGKRVPVLTAAACNGDSHWSPWSAWVLNLSDRRKLENRLREAGKLESIGLLAGGIAHDFNNILTSVLGNTSLAFETLPEGAPSRRFLASAMRSAERAADLTRQLLAYAGKGQVLIRSVDFSTLARETGQLLRCSIPRNVELELQLASPLPPVQGDFTQFQQLLMNLVINASEAIGDQPGMVRVVTETVRVDQAWLRTQDLDPDLPPGLYVSVEVQDNGCGMSADTRQHIFDPFFTTKFTGRGLGLAAATGIVRAHKGVLRVRSIPDRGSIFTVLLPASAPVAKTGEASGEIDAAAVRQEPAVEEVPQPEATIMVVDDEDIVRETAKSALELYGYTVVIANDGREALDLYRGLSHSIAMVVLDMSMPRMSGEETLGNIMAINPAARVLLTSGFEEEETLQRLMEKGSAGFLPKPYTANILAAKVRDVLTVR